MSLKGKTTHAIRGGSASFAKRVRGEETKRAIKDLRGK